MRAIDVVRRVALRARPAYLEAFEHGDALLYRHGVTTPLRLAHFLAQVLHETGGLAIAWENMNYSGGRLQEVFGVGRHSAAVTAVEAAALAHHPEEIAERVYGLGNPRKARELGNTQAGDGFRFRGGGIMQTTGRANYRRMGQRCGVDLEAYPEWVCWAQHALKRALAAWSERNLNAAADRDDIHTITRQINGGYNGLADRQAWCRRVRPLIDQVDLEPSDAPPGPAPKPPAPPPAKQRTGWWAALAAALAGAAHWLGAHWLEVAQDDRGPGRCGLSAASGATLMLGTILGWLGNLLGGPFARAGVDAYRVKLDATTSSERVTADLAGRELAVEQREAELRAQVLIAEQGNAATRWVRPRWALPFIAWTWKVVRTASVRRRASRPSRYRSWDIVASFNSRCESYDLAAQRIAIRP